ncbi:putative diphthamide synthesis protein [Elsinoe fawcettii]|nr:putative diphthamide synthesis protein [Elsinoe fawcettii]
MDTPGVAPVLSTPDAHMLEKTTTTTSQVAFPTLSEDEVSKVYEVERTAFKIIHGGWHKIALQFPDDMLRDGPKVFDLLQQRLSQASSPSGQSVVNGDASTNIKESLSELSLESRTHTQEQSIKITILADTSYGACCVDEIAAEHVDADVVVHYGRTCLSPTARLPVIYVYTVKPLDQDFVVQAFLRTYPVDQRVVLLADVPYQGHVDGITSKLRSVGYSNIFAPSIIHDPSSLIPNRTIPPDVQDDPEVLKQYSIFHLAEPPAALLLNLSSRVDSIHILPADNATGNTIEAFKASTAMALRRRYALVAKLSTVPIFGILINTLSVKNYMHVLQHVKDIITEAGKKYYTFVVGKVNAAKVANFSEVGGWVVIGCWESSLIESTDFWKPIITPFELKMALTDERDRIWTGEWNSDFQAVLDAEEASRSQTKTSSEMPSAAAGDDDVQEESDEESEPPVFDLRTGRYVSQSRPMARQSARQSANGAGKSSTSLIKRAGQELAQIGGEVSPAAEFLRSKRTWQGLGSDREIQYQYDDDEVMLLAKM